MFINQDMTIDELMIKIQDGQKYFYRIDFGEGEITDAELNFITFEECIMSVTFKKSLLRNSWFYNSNIKCCGFYFCNLTNAVIENCSVEGVEFKDAILDGITFNNNYFYGSILNQEDLGLLII